MKNIKKIIGSALLATAFAATSIGTTFALFTDEAKTTINVQSGIVDVNASLGNPVLYSASSTYTTGDVAGTIATGPFAGTYYYEPQEGLSFANGGEAAISDGGSILTIARMTPGDKVKSSLGFVNHSNVDILYRITVESSSTSDETLLANMELKLLGRTYVGLKRMRTSWKPLEALAPITGTDTEVILPLEAGNENQNKSVSYAFSIEAVQGNAIVTDDDYAEYVTLATSSTTDLVAEDVNNDSTLANQKVLETKLSATAEETQTVKVTIPENALLEEDVSNLTLYVENMGETEQQGIVVALDQGSELYEVTLDGLDESNDVPVLVQVNLGYEPVAIYHVHGSGSPTVVDFTYDSDTGITSFYTNNFSDYTFIRETEVIEVYTLNKLKEVRDYVNSGHPLSGKIVRLMVDIDLSDDEEWTPMGTKTNPFGGTLDGNNHTINGLTATDTLDLSAYDKKAFGFIGMTGSSNVTIKDLTFTNVSINLPNSEIAGVALGYAPSSHHANVLVDNVKVSGSGIYAKNCPAGVVGKAYNTGDVTIKNCETDIVIESLNRAAGICGYVSGPASAHITGNTIKKNVYAMTTGVDLITLFTGVGKNYVYDNNNEIGKMYYQGEEFTRDYTLSYTYDLEGNATSVTYSNFVGGVYGTSHNAAKDVEAFNDGTIVNKYAPTSDMKCYGNVTISDMDFSLTSANSLKVYGTTTFTAGTFEQIDTKPGATVIINGGNYGVEGNSSLGIRNSGGTVYINHLDSYTSNVLNYENTGTYHLNFPGNFMVYDSLNNCHDTTEHTFVSDHNKVTYVIGENLSFEILDDQETVGTYRHLNVFAN